MKVYLAINQEKHGPYTVEDVNGMLGAGQITASTLAWHSGQPEWLPVSNIAGISPETETPPVPLTHSVPEIRAIPETQPVQMTQSAHEAQQATPKTSKLAISSLVLGILTLPSFGLAAIPALVTGHMARGRIRRSNNTLSGKGLALAGLICGYVGGIFIFAGVLYPAIGVVKDLARKAEAKAAVNQIAAAVKNYYTEYGKYPLADYPTASDLMLGDKTTGTATDDNAELFNILRAKPVGKNVDNKFNPRRIVFFEGKSVTDANAPKSGFLDTPGAGAVGAFYDPWGKEYTIIIDSNYNGVINLTGIYSDFTLKSEDSIDTGAQIGVGVFSLGKDGEIGSPKNGVTGAYRKDGKVSDDILSWQ